MSFAGVFSIGLSGLNAFAKGLEAVSSNIANSQTSGYKRVRTDFSALLPTDAAPARSAISPGAANAGVGATARQLVFEQGAVTRTNQSTNVAIAGDGLFIVSRDPATTGAAGEFLFTRAGDFTVNAAGQLVSASGYFLQGAPVGATGGAALGGLGGLSTVNVNAVPAGADLATLGALTGVDIDADGFVSGQYANGETRRLYQIPLALFANPNGLEEAEATAFRQSLVSGEALLQAAREGRAGSIEGAALEVSTVDIGEEFTTLIETQRAYATNARVISTADELWRRLIETAA